MKKINAYLTIYIIISAISISCKDRPIQPSLYQDDNILLEFRNTNDENLFHDENIQSKVNEISLFTYENDIKKDLDFTVKINHKSEGNLSFSGIYTDNMNKENQSYYIIFDSKIDTLQIVRTQKDEKYQCIETLYHNGNLIEMTLSHPNRSHFILQR